MSLRTFRAPAYHMCGNKINVPAFQFPTKILRGAHSSYPALLIISVIGRCGEPCRRAQQRYDRQYELRPMI